MESLVSGQLLKHARQLRLELLDRPIVDDHIRRSLRLFLLRELSGRALLERLMAASSGALRSQLLLGDHREGCIEDDLHPGLEQ